MDNFLDISWSLLQGFGLTCAIFFITLIIALPLGLLLSFGTMCRFRTLRAILKTFIWIIRGTPLMLQVLVVYYGPALLFDVGFLPRLMAVAVAFVINYSCYFSEVYRGGIESIAKGQYEAGQVLGMTRSQIFFRVVLLQVIKRILAPMSNEIITLVKDTALARVIMIDEILKVAYDYAARGIIWPLFFTAVYYLAFVGILTVLFGLAEKKLNYFKV